MSEEPHVAQVIAQLREAAAKKCWPCACLHQSLAAIERAIPNAERPADLDAALNAARERLTAVKYECLGCQVCLPACTVTRLSNHPSGSTPPSFVAYGGRHWMSRVVLFICALMQAQVIVSVALSPTTICPERCDDDGADGRCPPACLSCAPSAHAPTPLPAPLVTVPSVQREPLFPVAAVYPPEPDPTDILHVPKNPLA